MRGRKRKPLEKQIAEGDPRKKGKAKLQEELDAAPKATSGLPSCPRHLKGRARYAWNFWSEELKTMGIDKRPDAIKLEGACRAYDRAVQADLEVERDGQTVKELFINDAGEAIVLRIKKHPSVEISNRSWMLVRSFGSDFGFDPVSRMRIKTEKSSDGDDDELLKALSAPRAHHPGSSLTQ